MGQDTRVRGVFRPNVRKGVDTSCGMVLNGPMSTTNPTTYRIAPRPTGPSVMGLEWDCAFCNHEDLAHPVFLTDGTRVISAGSGCAAVALYGRRDAATTRRVVAEFDHATFVAAQDEELRAERRERYTRAVEAFRADDDNTLFETNVRRTYFALGGHEVLGSFPGWLEFVAETGELEQ